MESPKDPFQNFILTSYLDEVESRVSALHQRAESLLQDKDSTLAVLAQLKAEAESAVSISQGDCQDMLLHIEQLEKRCQALEVKVVTLRTPQQASALEKVNEIVLDLERQCILGDPRKGVYRRQAQPLLNACLSESSSGASIDFRFQGMILDCKLEDQKSVRHRLECLVDGRCHPNTLEVFSKVLVMNGKDPANGESSGAKGNR